MKKFFLFLFIAAFLVPAKLIFAQPIAVSDYFSPLINPGDSVVMKVLVNDYSPSGSSFKISEIQVIGFGILNYQFNDTCVWFTPTINFGSYYEMQIKYRTCHYSAPTVLSNWAYVTINSSRNALYPIAKNDTVEIEPGQTITIDLLANDYDPDGSTMYVNPSITIFSDYGLPPTNVGNGLIQLTLSVDNYLAMSYQNFQYRYQVTDIQPHSSSTSDQGLIYIKLKNVDYFNYLDINNINARFSCLGSHFWDLNGKAEFYWPAGSTKTALFGNTLWIGGESYDTDTTLHISAEKFRANGGDFYPGPISNQYNTAFDEEWTHTWKLNRDEIEYHQQHWWETLYTPSESILTWPGNGNTSQGQASLLAPFFDADSDGLYEPMQGDYPQIRGDQAIFFIFNDERGNHYETGGTKMGIEIHGMAYGFNNPSDTILHNTVFLHYDIYNRRDTTYHNTFIGTWTEGDLGYYKDDYVGCNVDCGYFYFFNGNYIDGTGQAWAYGLNPPTVGIKVLRGPVMDPDTLDNPNGGCDFSVNGSFFGDGIIDNERYGMTKFIYYKLTSGGLGEPVNAIGYYNYLQGKWADGSPLCYFGTGHLSDPAADPNFPAHFQFPGISDPCGLGTGTILPYWDEYTEDFPPGDRRGLASSGPFTFTAGQKQSVDFAYFMSPNVTGLNTSCHYIDSLFTYNPAIFSNIHSLEPNTAEFKLYPNPANNLITIESLITTNEVLKYSISDISGKVLLTGIFDHTGKTVILLNNLAKGLYFITLSGKSFRQTLRIVKI